MKLFLCARCNEVFNLSHDYKECRGGHGGGQYVDSLNAKVWGDPTLVFVLGFQNSSLTFALRSQLKDGDLPPSFEYGGKTVSEGRKFTAFVIPDTTETLVRTVDRFSPIEPAILSQTTGTKD